LQQVRGASQLPHEVGTSQPSFVNFTPKGWLTFAALKARDESWLVHTLLQHEMQAFQQSGRSLKRSFTQR
jgi:hypothetical protein